MVSDFRKRLREIARRRAKGLPPLPASEKGDIKALSEIWPAGARDGVLVAEPPWPTVVPRIEDENSNPKFPLAAYDIETMGLRGMPIFLIGFAFLTTDGIALRQYIAGHISEENALLSAAARDLGLVTAVATYNGAAFDLPETEERAARYQIEWDGFPHHFDLLHIARRCYKGRLPDFKLRTVEEGLLGFVRDRDLPSAEVPRMYNVYSQTGDGRPLVPVLEHNLIDVAATLALLVKLAGEFPDEFTIPDVGSEKPQMRYPLFENR
ncbi:MAG: ribonuclease H-like domain-containing protein [bacterium]|nr:ribonuclease H-like domain-containing protein [bacterium]